MFEGFSHSAATRVTSAGASLRQRSRCRKKRRQSPSAIHSESWTPNACGSFTVWSNALRNLARTRSSSSCVIGRSFTPNSVASIASRAGSTGSPRATCAKKIAGPGSWVAKLQFCTEVALRVSTSAW